MEREDFSSIEEIDAALDEEFDFEDDEEILDELEDDEDLSDDDEELASEEEENVVEKKTTKENKQEYAFAKLREEKVAAERKAEQEASFMKKLAKASGYGDDIDSYRKDLEARLVEEEAKQRGITPEVYQELADAKAKLEAYEKKEKENTRISRSQAFLKTIDDVLSEYDVDSKSVSQELFDSLEQAGYTLETLLSIPQPEFLIRGALYDKLNNAELKDKSMKNGVETKKIKSKSAEVKTMDELIEEEMVAYAKSRGLKYVK